MTCRALGVPTIDLSLDRSIVSQQIVIACEEYGFFRLINHRVSNAIISRVEEESFRFFAKPRSEKQQAGPPNPLGYGCRTIGLQGDTGELEYLLLAANPPPGSKLISNNDLQIIWLINDVESDAVFRVNHYPPLDQTAKALNPADPKFILPDDKIANNVDRPNPSPVGFGEHSDPQILTIMRTNDVGGFQFFSQDGVWIPIPPNPAEFCVIVGDTFQALTNDRFKSARHRVMANSKIKPRLSMLYFGAPSLDATICPLPPTVSSQHLIHYRPFTWREFKKATYSQCLAVRRLDLFKYDNNEHNEVLTSPEHGYNA